MAQLSIIIALRFLLQFDAGNSAFHYIPFYSIRMAALFMSALKRITHAWKLSEAYEWCNHFIYMNEIIFVHHYYMVQHLIVKFIRFALWSKFHVYKIKVQ